ncbi:MAG TPA: LysM peptidoglycan-binding domain-containing protein [Candidatus Saccharimonadia bacterium]|nr:LysM peptidoglycan-binding domain-containing protein [Candidatus Saccharimonadia bacterium]
MSKTRLTAQKKVSATVARTSREVVGVVRTHVRPRYLAHLSLLGLASFLVLGNNPTQAHLLSVRLMSAQAGPGATLDDSGTASVAAEMAQKSDLLITSEASKTATTKSQQVALLTSDNDSLAKRQVVSTAGNATRDITSYTVQAGDTLSVIATHFGITTDTVLWANNLDDADSLKPGQSLTILPVSGLLYTVKGGDTADSLASAYQANAAQILSYNNAEVKGLTPGAQIIIPDGVKPEAPKPAAPVVAATRLGSVASAATVHLTPYFGGANGYSFGYCTYYVASRRSVPSNWGDANKWYTNAQASGFSVGATPVPGAIAWTGVGYAGHVAYVESVSGGMVTVSEMNFNGNWDRVTSRTVPASSFRYIY